MASITTRKLLSTITALCFVALFSVIGVKLLTGSKAATGTAFVHTDGTSIIGTNGKPIYFSGIDVDELVAGQGKAGDVLQGKSSTLSGTQAPSSCTQLSWKSLTQGEMKEISSAGMNTVRLAVTWANIEPIAPTKNSDGSFTHYWDTTYLKAIDNEIQYAENAHLMVILDMHQASWSPIYPEGTGSGKYCGDGMPSWLYGSASDTSGSTARTDFWENQVTTSAGSQETPWAGYEAAWEELLTYSSNGVSAVNNPTVVGADMFNEPTGESKAYLPAFYHDVGNDIRNVDANIILIYEDDAYTSFVGANEGNPPASPPVYLLSKQPDLATNQYGADEIYSWHYYPTADWGDEIGNTGLNMVTILQDHISRAHTTANDWPTPVPIWIGENSAFGVTDATGTPPGQKSSGSMSQSASCTPLPEADTWENNLCQMLTYFTQKNVSWTYWDFDGMNSPKGAQDNPKVAFVDINKEFAYSPSTPPPPTPTVTITAPTAGEVLLGTETVSATASVSSGSISKITLSEVNSSGTSTTLTSCSSVSSCSYSWNTNNVSNGNYTINASASASGGGSATAIPVKVSVANAPTCTPPIISTPSGLASPTGDQTTSSITLTWGASTDCKNLAITYHVFRAESGNWKQVGSPTATSYTDTGLTPGTTYDYEVDATDTGGNTSAMSSTASATTQRICTSAPATPTGLDATDIEATTATLSWDAVSNLSNTCVIASYEVSITDTANNTITTKDVLAPATSYPATSLTPLTNYTFTVVAVTNDSTPSNPSNLYPFTTGKPVCSDLGPTTPSGLSFPIVGTTGVTLSWNESTDSCSGISGYNVFREQQGSSSFTQVNAKLVPQPGSGTTVSFGDSGLSPATAYNYYVVAVSGENKTAQSTTAAVTTLDSGPKTPYDFKAKASTNQIALSWQDSDPGFPASKLHYSVYRNPTNPPTGTPTYTTQQGVASQTDTGLAPNTPYFYAVTATNLSGQTSAAYITPNPITTTKLCPNPPGTPSGLAASAVTATSATLGWNAVSNPSSSCKVVQYVLTRKDNATGSVTNLPVPPGDPTQLPLTPPPATSYDDSGLTPNTSYSYTVVAVTNDGTPSATASAPVTFTTGTPTCTDNGPTAPTLSGVAANNDQVNLSWSASSDSCSNISGYEVWREDPGSTSFQELTTSSTLVSGLTYGDGTVSPATTYNYYVVAVSGESKTAQSNTVPVTTPTNPVNPNNGGNSGTGSNGSNSPLDSNPLLIGTTSVGSGSEAGGSVSQNPTSTSPGLSPLPSNPSKAKLTTKKLSSSPVAAVLYSLAGVALLAGCMVLIVFRRHHRYRPAATTPYDPDIFQPQVIHPEITPTVPPDPAQVIHPDNDPNQTNENNKEN